MRLRLATKILIAIVGVVTIGTLSSAAALIAAWQVERHIEATVAEHVPSVRATEGLELALLSQRGLVSSYLLAGGDPIWLERLREVQPEFQRSLAEIRQTRLSNEEVDLLTRLEKTYAALDSRRGEVIALYQQGDLEKAKSLLLTDVNDRLNREAYSLCEQLVAANDRDVGVTTARAVTQIRRMTWAVALCDAVTIGLGGILLWLFIKGVSLPLRGMVADARLFHGDRAGLAERSPEDETRAVGKYLRSLMSDVAATRSRLEQSQQRLLNAEKLASVGKLAASVAHEIRNPLTAVKMWLFSIRESVRGNPELDRKVGIVPEEITRLESIVRNFLEFSRPPALHRQAQSIVPVIDQTLELLGPRLQEGRIRVRRVQAPTLPPARADAERLKQVLINLIANAADAMGDGGELRISTAVEPDPDGRAMVVVRIEDTGSGMAPDVQDRVFEPFFTTKEQGTGLGLCIAAQIIDCHDGLLVLEKSNEHGTVFAVWTPVAQ